MTGGFLGNHKWIRRPGPIAAAAISSLTIGIVLGAWSPWMMTVPNVTGYTREASEPILENAHLRAAWLAGEEHPYELETIVYQNPKPGDRVLAWSTVTLEMSGFEDQIEVPSFVGLVGVDAARMALRLGLRTNLTTADSINPYDWDTGMFDTHVVDSNSLSIVTSQTPTAGTVVRYTEELHLVVEPAHSQNSTPAKVYPVHGHFYRRYGFSGPATNCNPCHSPSTCTGLTCHAGQELDDLEVGFAKGYW